MLPSVLAKQLQRGLSDYIETAFPMTNPPFRGSLRRVLETPDAVFHEPYVAVRLPFRVADDGGARFEAIHSPFKPYVHQRKAFARLTGEKARSTLIATGTGSGKTECFLYPILEYCYQHREERGIKAILIYPMNALASDQAIRIAKLVSGSLRLRGSVTVGMCVGGAGASSQEMGPENVITHRDTLRAAPPSILITNYKMLDYLLVRPRDAPIWADNGPDTLKYIAVDELHTFDGAQGTDLACLLRRLKARLGTPKGRLCCVGTSATMGGGESARDVLAFAEKIFGEPFERDAVVTEDRLSPAEFFAGRAAVDYTLPTQAQTDRLNRLAQEEDHAGYLKAAAQAWLESPPDGDLSAPEKRLALGRLLMGHGVCQNMLSLMDGKYVQVSSLCQELARSFPPLDGLSDPAAAVNGLLALISHARSGSPDRLRPFLTVQVQLWLRELRRLVASVDREVTYALSAELNAEQSRHYLPVVNCRECGETGWVGLKNERGGVEIPDLDAFYTLYFRRDSRVIMMFPHATANSVPSGMAWGALCPDCLRLNAGEQSGPCRTCGGERCIPVLFPTELNTADTQNNRQFVCPCCGGRRGLAIIGVRSATEIGAGISQLFASRFNDDKKTLAFSDSVQDAAHRAGFFNARTWRFGLRGAIQHYAQNGGAGKNLEDFQAGFVDYWKKRWPAEEFVGRLIAPNMVWMRAYESMTKTGKLGSGRLEQKLLRDVEQRSKYEIMLEYGLSSRMGRTLEKSGCSTLAFPMEEVERTAILVRERVVNELGALAEAEGDCFSRMVLGFLDIMRRNGAFDDPALNLYAATGKSFDLSNNQKTRRDWMPGVRSGRNTPRLLYVPARPGKKVPAFDRVTARNYVQRLSGCLARPLVGEGVLEETARIIFEELGRAGIVVPMPEGAEFTPWALSRKHIFVSTDVRQFACSCCGTTVSAAGENGAVWEGAPCARPKCPGRLRPAPASALDYYGKLYSSGDLVRVVAREHTGLLERSGREALERSFRSSGTLQRPWDANVLSCTPTLEMGIDIGDLSTVILCGIPPAQAQFRQRAGRAGRKDGNALTVVVANAKPHDLYFYADPVDMMAGGVKPPTIFLQASAVLERQFMAYCMDCWIARGAPEKAVPSTLRACLSGMKKRLPERFPFNLLSFIQANAPELAEGFIRLFSPQIDEETARELRTFARGEELQGSPLLIKVYEAFAGLWKQRDARTQDIRRLTKMIRQLETKPQDSSYDAEIQELKSARAAFADAVQEIDSKDTFNFLSDEGLLPNYAFPEDSITLKAVLRRKGEESAGEERPGWQRMVYEYSRSAASAISEFAPMNSFYAGGRKLTIDQVDLTTAQIERWRLCPNCSHAQREVPGQRAAACPRCGAPAWGDSGQLRSMLKLRMVYSNDDWKQSLIGEDSDERTPTAYNKRIFVDVDESRDVSKAYEMNNSQFHFGYEFVKRATLREINFGERELNGERFAVAGSEEVRRGFRVCRHCGKLLSAGGGEHAFPCRARNAPAGAPDAAEQLFLYREFSTEALRILIPATTMDASTVRQESFTAAFLLGMKECFGNVDHLQAVVSEEPVPGMPFRKQYLVIYDCVPGGTGYLKQLIQRSDGLVEVFQQALRVLENCSCREDGRDGCYHCLYAYRQSSHIGQISRRTATQLLKAIISGQDNLREIPSLGAIPVKSLLESELERRFIQALDHIRGEKGPMNLVEILVNGKEGYRLNAGDCVWEVEPQVELGAEQGVARRSRADFVLWPVRAAGRRPVAVFTDGFFYHKDRTAEDACQREAIRRGGRFRVWVLSWKDVQSVFSPQGDYATPTLFPQRMPAGTQMYQPTVAGSGGEALRTDRLSPMELLVRYLELDRGEELFQIHARAYALSLLEPGKRGDVQAYTRWKAAVDEISQALYGHRTDFARSDLFFGCWTPRQGQAHMTVYAGVSASDMRARKTQAPVAVFALLADGRKSRGDWYEAEWNGYWQFFNVMQFLDSFGAVTATGLDHPPEGQRLGLV